MRPIATDRVAWSVCRSVTTVSRVKAAEAIVIPVRDVDPRNHVIDGVQIAAYEGAILMAKRDRPGTCLGMSVGRYTQSYSVGGITGTTVRMPIGVYYMGCTLAQPGEYE